MQELEREVSVYRCMQVMCTILLIKKTTKNYSIILTTQERLGISIHDHADNRLVFYIGKTMIMRVTQTRIQRERVQLYIIHTIKIVRSGDLYMDNYNNYITKRQQQMARINIPLCNMCKG